MSAILKDVPKPVSTLLPSVPQALERLIATCLEKDPHDRWQTARDLLRELRWIETNTSPTGERVLQPLATGARRGRAIPVGVAALMALGTAVLAAIGTWMFKPGAPTRSDIVRLTLPLDDRLELGGRFTNAIALSPDGAQLAYVAFGPDSAPQLYARALKSLETRPVQGTEGASRRSITKKNSVIVGRRS
jgi:eukaryotic-like serine/threonine-protein kinase